ncbi:MAG: cytochrome c [Pseudomonadales bacterium]|nr:cytochrome c [Pseudomonadales bacterium]
MGTFLVAALLAIWVSAAKAADASVGWYTKDQARAGKKLYMQHCLSCHPAGYFGPVFKAWKGERLASLYTVMAEGMPESNPGGLDREVYTQVLAYILKDVGYPRGEQPLEPGSDRFMRLVIE